MISDLHRESMELFVLEEVAPKPTVVLVVLLAANDGTVEAAECVLGVMHESSSASNDV